MRNRFRCICSIILTLAMLLNLIPLRAFAQNSSLDDAYIIEEVVEKRTEFSKEFALSNGLRLAAVYDNAVHYFENGQWKEIDNTLKLANTRVGNAYINTAGSWQVAFPQNLTNSNGVTISRDQYTFSFRMSGELHRPSDNAVVMEADYCNS